MTTTTVATPFDVTTLLGRPALFCFKLILALR